MNTNSVPTYIAVSLENTETASLSTWLPLPATKKQFSEALERIKAVDGGFAIAGYTHLVPGMCRKELNLASLAAVNHLAARLKKLGEDEITKLCAIWDTDHYFCTVAELIDYTFNTDSYTLLPDICDAEALGAYHTGGSGKIAGDARIIGCIDRRELGLKLAEMENGQFSPFGYITSKIGWDLNETVRRIPESLNLKGWLGEDLYGNWKGDYIG